jgi:hypothetical protein
LKENREVGQKAVIQLVPLNNRRYQNDQKYQNVIQKDQKFQKENQ